MGDMNNIFVGRRIAERKSSFGSFPVYSLDLSLLFPVFLRACLALRSKIMRADDSFMTAIVTRQMTPLCESGILSVRFGSRCRLHLPQSTTTRTPIAMILQVQGNHQ